MPVRGRDNDILVGGEFQCHIDYSGLYQPSDILAGFRPNASHFDDAGLRWSLNDTIECDIASDSIDPRFTRRHQIYLLITINQLRFKIRGMDQNPGMAAKYPLRGIEMQFFY